MRLVVLLLGSLMALTLAFKLEVVLGAFAAGIVLRQVLPRGDESLELKIEGLAFGLLIPCFFITSGMGIDPRAVADRPLLLLGFLSLILLVRGVPVYLATRLERSSNGRQVFSGRDSLRIALYGATGLPIIVAVASVAVRNGQMAAQSAWLVVAAGAVTVLLLPTSATLIGARGASGEAAPKPSSVPAADGGGSCPAGEGWPDC